MNAYGACVKNMAIFKCSDFELRYAKEYRQWYMYLSSKNGNKICQFLEYLLNEKRLWKDLEKHAGTWNSIKNENSVENESDKNKNDLFYRLGPSNFYNNQSHWK